MGPVSDLCTHGVENNKIDFHIESKGQTAVCVITPCISLDFSCPFRQLWYLDPSEFQTAVQWWLGVNPSLSLDGNPMVCALCPNCALDPLGYHCVTCKRGGDAGADLGGGGGVQGPLSYIRMT